MVGQMSFLVPAGSSDEASDEVANLISQINQRDAENARLAAELRIANTEVNRLKDLLQAAEASVPLDSSSEWLPSDNKSVQRGHARARKGPPQRHAAQTANKPAAAEQKQLHLAHAYLFAEPNDVEAPSVLPILLGQQSADTGLLFRRTSRALSIPVTVKMTTTPAPAPQL